GVRDTDAPRDCRRARDRARRYRWRMRRAIPIIALGWLLTGCPEDPLCADDDACGAASLCVDGACQQAFGVVVIDSFTASPTQVSSGEPATLTWSTRDAARCELEPGFGAVPRSGSVVIR